MGLLGFKVISSNFLRPKYIMCNHINGKYILKDSIPFVRGHKGAIISL